MKKVVLVVLALSSFNAAAMSCAEFMRPMKLAHGVALFEKEVVKAKAMTNRATVLSEVWDSFISDIHDEIKEGRNEYTSAMWRGLRYAIDDVCKGKDQSEEIYTLIR